MEKIKWEFMQVETSSFFFGGFALHLWGGPRELANRALDLSRVKENIPGRSPIKLIEANLLRLQISLYFDYLKRDQTLTNVQRAKLVSESITNMRFKIRDLRKREKKMATRGQRRNVQNNRKMRYNYKENQNVI
ncbi:hypothetical protein TSAR_001114 [Trichomalopsis sarcophagae]|uniref:Uncharacterized protein n=1 Tax=Trichomalopsis sarcophagae TaxID=543379 RepID=A0A232ESX4_9HYME|nr:hypothetical protein TSAR_001114 [Trichomalopsis sarcophagae]